jgi:hypothetical protein
MKSSCESRHSGALANLVRETGFPSVAIIKTKDCSSFNCYLKRGILLTLLRLFFVIPYKMKENLQFVH